MKNPQHELDDLPFHLVRAAIAFRRMNDCALREIGMKSQPLGAGLVLHQLFAEDSCTINRLVKQTQIPNGTLTGVLDGLERDGLIRRVKNAEDGRSWLIQLTAKAAVRRETIMKRHGIIMELFDAVLTREESAQLKRALHRLTESMNDYVGARSLEMGGAKTKRPVKSAQKQRQA